MIAHRLESLIEGRQEENTALTKKILDSVLAMFTEVMLNPLESNVVVERAELDKLMQEIKEEEADFYERQRRKQQEKERVGSAHSKQTPLPKNILEFNEFDRENLIYRAVQKKLKIHKMKAAPFCMRPSSLEPNFTIENYRLDRDYFDKQVMRTVE